MRRIWRDHSRTILGLTLGSALVLAGRVMWPEGGVDFDIVTLIGGVLLALGLQGIIDNFFREVAKPED
jgi:hypothetical protein